MSENLRTTQDRLAQTQNFASKFATQVRAISPQPHVLTGAIPHLSGAKLLPVIGVAVRAVRIREVDGTKRMSRSAPRFGNRDCGFRTTSIFGFQNCTVQILTAARRPGRNHRTFIRLLRGVLRRVESVF
jgi:hypothetical protein